MLKHMVLLIMTFAGILYGQQDSSRIQIITLSDGSELKGFIIEEDSSVIQFKTLSGVEMEIDRMQIKEMEEHLGKWHSGEFRMQDPNSSRLFFAPAARTLKAGEGYFSIYEIFFPSIAIGVTDFLTINGGMSLFPGADQQLLFIAPKVRFVNTEIFQLSSGILYAGISDESFGIAYGVFTIGSSIASLTGGLGLGFVNGDFSENPFLMIGGELQLSNSVKFLTENWILPESETALISFGLRFFGRHLAADFALMTITEEVEGFPFIPWIGFAYNF